MNEKNIWNQRVSLEDINRTSANSMIEHLGIVYTGIGDDYLSAVMPVDKRTIQPMGLLHGGASAVLAETLGSVASYLVIDRSKFSVVGLNIEVHHVKSVKTGMVTGVARPLHLGQKTHMWDIKIYDDNDKLVSVSILKTIVLPVEVTVPVNS